MTRTERRTALFAAIILIIGFVALIASGNADDMRQRGRLATTSEAETPSPGSHTPETVSVHTEPLSVPVIDTVIEVTTTAERATTTVQVIPTTTSSTTTTTTVAPGPPDYVRGDCDSLADLLRWHGAIEEEIDFFLGRPPYGGNVLWRESGCGLDTYNDSSGDTGFCMLTHWHSKPGWAFGTKWSGGWARDLFGLEVGKIHGGKHRDHPNIAPACLYLLRDGEPTPGVRNVRPWDLTR